MADLVLRSNGLDLYVHPIPGKKNRWWFRRRVPLELASIIDCREWRYRLKARSEGAARREAVPFLEETDETIRLTLAGKWPPITDEEIQATAVGWWASFRESRFSELRLRLGRADAWFNNTDPTEWALANEDELRRSLDDYLRGPRNLEWIMSPERELIIGLLDNPKRTASLRRNNDAMVQLFKDCHTQHHAQAKAWADVWRDRDRAADRVTEAMHIGLLESRQIERLIDGPAMAAPIPTSAPEAIFVAANLPPIPFDNHRDPENDLIGQWARYGSAKRAKPPGTKTIYEARRMMRKLEAFVGFDDLRRLTRKHVQDWIDSLNQTKVKSGRLMSSGTVAQHLIQLKSLANFAVDRDLIETNPAARVHYTAETRTKIRAFTEEEARYILEAARREKLHYKRWLPWLCCFTGCRLDEPAGAAVADIEQIGPYWVLNIRLDNRHEGASIKNQSSMRKVPLHPVLIREGFIDEYVKKLPKVGPLFPSLKPDKFGSKGGTATKRIGPIIRGLSKIVPSVADKNLSPSHSWRHRLHDECRRLNMREDVENALTGHAQKGGGPGYGEYAILEVLGPAMEEMRSPFGAP